jgi:hypothetical protein
LYGLQEAGAAAQGSGTFMSIEFTREERDRLLARIHADKAAIFPANEEDALPDLDRARRLESFYVALGEYSDRLPRVPMSVCPYCGETLLRTFDPYGLNGPWWHVTRPFEVEEPRACEHFKVLVGAYHLERQAPEEADDPVRPGPDVPFVIPAVLTLPGMIAVVAELRTQSGDRAFPIAYFSDQEVAPELLHQPWLRDTHWFRDESGRWSWNVANDEYDFELTPYLQKGTLRWTDLTKDPPVLHKMSERDRFPWFSLQGDRRPQLFSSGKRETLELPTGETPVPFGEPDDPPPYEGDLEARKKEAYEFLDDIAPQLELTKEELEELGGPFPED